MLKQRLCVVSAIGVLLLALMPTDASAENDVDCDYRTCWNNAGGEVIGSSRTGSSSGDSGGSRSGEKSTKCYNREQEVSCTTSFGTWSSTVGAWCKRADPQPLHTDAVWAGRTDGSIYICVWAQGGATYVGGGVPFFVWLPGAPELPPPDPEVLAWRAVAQLRLSPVVIAAFPQPTSVNPDSMGIVGFPVPVWADTSQADLGTRHASASERGFTVSLTATLDKVVWDFGDGSQPVTCFGTGIPYRLPTLSPEYRVACGYQSGYQDQGDYVITATAHWNVAWQGIGRSGTITQDLGSETQLRVGEYQVVNVMPQ